MLASRCLKPNEYTSFRCHGNRSPLLAGGCVVLLQALLCWSSYFDDFPLVIRLMNEASTMSTAKPVFRLLGVSYAENKLWPFQLLVEMFGVEFDIYGAPEGQFRVRSKASRIKELVHILEIALKCKKLVPAELSSFIGKVRYAEGKLWKERCLRRRDIAFVDNWTALHVLTKGSSSQRAWRDLLMLLQDPSDPVITSQSILVDAPSRGTLQDLDLLGPMKIVNPKCPMLGIELRCCLC